jgi:hypothetical protein
LSNITNSFYRENLDIPRPAEQIQHKPASDEDVAKANLKNRKKLVPKPTSAMTAWYVLFSRSFAFFDVSGICSSPNFALANWKVPLYNVFFKSTSTLRHLGKC